MPKDKSRNLTSALETAAVEDVTVTRVGQQSSTPTAETEDVVSDWKPGDIIMDLYEVRTVREGFGEEAEEKPYHQGGFGRVYRVWHRMWDLNMAVKTPRQGAFKTNQQKESFIQECETWVNLGLHPHIAACHYVRELGDVPRIFSEYANAGSLSQWIHSERLYEGGKPTALARILDLAIQFAWGLHHAHESGVIHRDVKPLNALMWSDGSLKVTDFGLASARKHAVEIPQATDATQESATLFFSKGGMTPAYCSPEQAAGVSITQKTDLWSWAVSVLEMFQGEVTWQSGVLAEGALDIFLQHNGEDDLLPSMPTGVAEFLHRCFQKEPDNRPEDMLECANMLSEIYQSETGKPYPRSTPQAATDTPPALNNRALSFIDLGKHKESVELFDLALKNDPRNLTLIYNNGLLKWRSALNDDVNLITNLEVFRSDHPNSWRVLWALGQVDMERGDFFTSRSYFEKALLISGHDELNTALTTIESLDNTFVAHQNSYLEHTRPVDAVCISPDNRYLLSSAGSYILLQETASGKCLREFNGHRLTVTSLAFSPNGRFIVSGSKDDTIRIWEVASARCVMTLEGHEKSVLSVAVSADGHYLLSGSEDHTVKLWETKTGKCLQTFSGHKAAVRSVCFSSKGLFVLSGAGDYEKSADNTIKLWELATGKELRTFSGHDDYVASVCFSPDGLHLLSGGNDGKLLLWEMASGTYTPIFKTREGGIWSVAYSPDSKYVFAAGANKTIRQLDVSNGRCIRTFTGHKREISSIHLSREGKYMLSGSWDFTLKFWCLGERTNAHSWYTHAVVVDKALEKQHAYEAAYKKAKEALDSEDISMAIQHVAAARKVRGFERNPEVLELCRRIGKKARIKEYMGAWLHKVIAEHRDAVLTVAVSPNGRFAVSGGKDKTILVWKLDTGECIKTLDGHTQDVNSIVFSQDGRYLVSGGSDGAIRLWDFIKGESTVIFDGQEAPVYSVALSPDNDLVLSGDEEGIVKLWTVETGKLRRNLEGHLSQVTSVCFSPDMLSVVSASTDHTIKLWDIKRGRCYQSLNEHTSRVESVCLSSDGRLALSGGWGRKILLWDLSTGQCLREFRGHIGDVYCVAFSPDQKYIASCSGTTLGLEKDNAIRLWEIDTGRCLRTFEGHRGTVTTLAFSPDGRFIISGSEDASLFLWEIDWEYEF